MSHPHSRTSVANPVSEQSARRNQPSDHAKAIQDLFQSPSTRQEFTDLVYEWFSKYDLYNQQYQNNRLYKDTKFIIQYVKETLVTPKDPNLLPLRIDAYFYILCRIVEYTMSENGLMDPMEDFRRVLLMKLGQEFKSSKGKSPELYTTQREILRRINIKKHLSSFTDIKDASMLIQLLAMCKLIFQSTTIVHETCLCWLDLLHDVKQWKVSLADFVKQYATYKETFKPLFPLDAPAFIYLMRVTYSSKEDQPISFETIRNMLSLIELKYEAFFSEYRVLFAENIKQNFYEYPYIASLLQSLCSPNVIHYLEFYLEDYVLNTSFSRLWNWLLYYTEHHELKSKMESSLISIMRNHTMRISLAELNHCCQMTNSSIEKLKNINLIRLSRVLQEVIYVTLNMELYRQVYQHQILEQDAKQILMVLLKMNWTFEYTKPTYLFIVLHLLFIPKDSSRNKFEKLTYLFHRFNEFNEPICKKLKPEKGVQVQWLNDYFSFVPNDWLLLNQDNYEELCSAHQNNQWSLYIWSKIVYSSAINVDFTKDSELLIAMNERLVEVQRCQTNDIFTRIFVKSLFECVMKKHSKSLLWLPNIQPMIEYVLNARDTDLPGIDKSTVNNFVEIVQTSIRTALTLESESITYRRLKQPSIVPLLLSHMDFECILNAVDPQQYKFPITSLGINDIMYAQTPDDIDIRNLKPEKEFFERFIKQTNDWLDWFEKFVNIFLYIVEWFRTNKMEGADELYEDMYRLRYDSSITLLATKATIQEILNVFENFTDFERLSRLFNCAQAFEITDSGKLSTPDQYEPFLKETKRLRSNDTFTVNPKTTDEKLLYIDCRRHIRWSLACEQVPDQVVIEYQVNGSSKEIYQIFNGKDLPLNQCVLRGEFKTQQGGHLHMRVENSQPNLKYTLWYQIKNTSLSTCRLFVGIFDIECKKSFKPPNDIIKRNELNDVIERVFLFLDKLLNGTISLATMNEFHSVFHDANINVAQEVQKLFATQSISGHIPLQATTNDQQVNQVCKWLQTYQYYSHLDIIIDCVQKFNIISNDTNDQSVNHLQTLTLDENCPLREISDTYRDVYDRFERLSSEHLQLIKTILKYPNVVNMMKEAKLYSTDGRRRFQQLQDNLTTQFQLQERNSMILNSWITTFTLSEPFACDARSLEHFVDNVARLMITDENSCEHILVVNQNIQTIELWLSNEDATMLDNALVMMEYFYKTGVVNIHLQRLINKQSHYDIEYSIGSDNKQQIKSTMPMTDVADHRRQLTFCTSDLLVNEAYRKDLITEQLKLLEVVERVFSIQVKLENSGHPKYQCKEEHYQIYDTPDQLKDILVEIKYRSDQDLQQQLKGIIVQRTRHFEYIYCQLDGHYRAWINDLESYRNENSLLTLLSNRQIMIMIILLTSSTSPNSIRMLFLKNAFSCEDLCSCTSQMSIRCLRHYLESLRITNSVLSEEKLVELYEKYQISEESTSQTSLKALSDFMQELYINREDFYSENTSHVENQQYLVTLKSSGQQTSTDRRKYNWDRDAYCVLLNIFRDRLPANYQILWGSTATEDDIRLFFLRVRQFVSQSFVVLDIDEMHHRLRALLWEQHGSLSIQREPHAAVYYFTKESMANRKGIRPFHMISSYRDSTKTFLQFTQLMRSQNVELPQIKIISGKAGVGKTHRIRSEYSRQNPSCITINDQINLSTLISTLSSFSSNTEAYLYINLSLHAPFDQLNHLLFSLFVCRSLIDIESGMTFSLSLQSPWKFIIEVPHTDTSGLTPSNYFKEILPLLSIVSSSCLEEVTDENYQLSMGQEEELVARFFKAYQEGTIDRLSDGDLTVDFAPLNNRDEQRQYIYTCLDTHAHDLPRNKIFQLSFTKFLYRRVQFFTKPYYRYNSLIPRLGSTAMSQMIQEANKLSRMDFSSHDYHRIYLVYDRNFALQLLHNDWNSISLELKTVFKNIDPKQRIINQGKNYFAECLAWLINMKEGLFEKTMKEMNFILTENLVYKLFHIHERKLTKLPLIIEGETGVGKTFLLRFYSALLNACISHGGFHESTTAKISERTSAWLLKEIIGKVLEPNNELLSEFLQRMRNDNIDGENSPEEQQLMLLDIKQSLESHQYNDNHLKLIWKTIITLVDERNKDLGFDLIGRLYGYIKTKFEELPLIEASCKLKKILKDQLFTVEESIEIFGEFLIHTRVNPVFYRLLLHPGITEAMIVDFMSPISQLAARLPKIEIVVFFDEVNTSSCLGTFKEMFMDGTLHGKSLPKNIFFTAAINPKRTIDPNEANQIHRHDYFVHHLPESLENLKISYGTLDRDTLEEYIKQKIATFTSGSQTDHSIEDNTQTMLMESILNAQLFCKERLGENSVSQREVQRCFNLIDFFWKLRPNERNIQRCIALSIALIYYFRLPTREDNIQRNDHETPSREDFEDMLEITLPGFAQIIQDELDRFVNTENFLMPPGVAINQAIREHIFAIVVSVVTRTPLCIIGEPGRSKTLSFQIVLQNLQGSHLSPKPFCRNLPALDAFFCLGSKYTRSEDIAYIFDRAIKREEQYRQIRADKRCVVFLDEASLPDQKTMVLKVLHPYLDECQVAFIAIANRSFDAANANRMICVYRSVPSQFDQKVLAYGCLGLPMTNNSLSMRSNLEKIIIGLCEGYRKLLIDKKIPSIFHDRDFIYMLRELRFELPANTLNEDEHTGLRVIQPIALLRALEDNFNGIKSEEFQSLVKLFFHEIQLQLPDFTLPSIRHDRSVDRDIPTILHESLKLDSRRRRLYGRYKLLIDESEDESAVHLLLQAGIFDTNSDRTTIFRMSDFTDDAENELRNVEILSTIKLSMEFGKTILMVNTGRIHGSLYDVFNQNFSIMATGDTRKIFSKVSIGAKTSDVVVHEDFQCIVHVKRSELHTIPAPFLSRFQKYSLNIEDFYRIRVQKLSKDEQDILSYIEERTQSFVKHVGRQYFYGFNDNTLYSCLLSLIEMKTDREYSLFDISQLYTQLSARIKYFTGLDPSDRQQCLFRIVLVKLIQLVSPETIILKSRTFKSDFAQWLWNLYFHEQEHFNIDKFLKQLILTPLATSSEQNIHQITKVMIFTRTSSYIVGMNQHFGHESTPTDLLDNEEHGETQNILDLSAIENPKQLQERFDEFRANHEKNVLLIIIDGNNNQQRLHIPYIRHLTDTIEHQCNTNINNERKYFVILIHSAAQSLYHQSCFPSIFLHHWDFHFFDTCALSSAFYLQKLLQLLSPSTCANELDTSDDATHYDLSILFEDSLWDLCSRIEITAPNLPAEMFRTPETYEFYRQQTKTFPRVKCLKDILQVSPDLQKTLVSIYQQHLFLTKNSSLKKINDFIYGIAKDILCGKRFDGLVESVQTGTRNSFINFMSHIFKIIANDYGLETISQLSLRQQNYAILFQLADLESFTNEDNDDIFISKTTHETVRIITNYSCIFQTPLFHLFHQRIRSYANAIQSKDININPNETSRTNSSTFQRFRSALVDSIQKDKILHDAIEQISVSSYSSDLVRMLCAIIENNFEYDRDQYERSVNIISHWTLLRDEDDNVEHRDHVWRLAHVYATLEYEQTDVLSMYSACRIINRFDSIQSSLNDLSNEISITRSDFRDRFFGLVFDELWENLVEISSNNMNYQPWVYAYLFISKYYPSEAVLQRIQLFTNRFQIELMKLAYRIFLNETIVEPQRLVLRLLRLNSPLSCLTVLPEIIEIIQEHHPGNITLLVDVQQWITSICQSNDLPSEATLRSLLTYLNRSSMLTPLASKQLVFDQVIDLLLQTQQRERSQADLWDRFDLIPILVECISYINHPEQYRIPFHPSVNQPENPRIPMFDLYFYHLRSQMTDDIVTPTFLNKGLLRTLPTIRREETRLIANNLFNELKNYFLSIMIALLLCNPNLTEAQEPDVRHKMSTLTRSILSIDNATTRLSDPLQLFLSTIISKQSWSYLLNVLESDRLEQIDENWRSILHRLLQVDQARHRSPHLRLSHQIQFTYSHEISDSPMFSEMNQRYVRLREVIDTCVRNQTDENRWELFDSHMRNQIHSTSTDLEKNKYKSILLLIIYYDYYCTNRLESIRALMNTIPDLLSLLEEEKLVFRALLDPEQFIVGYHDEVEKNSLNEIFNLNCSTEFELALRHLMVNLMAMILLAGPQSFLWTFAFQPKRLENTYGFGSVYRAKIQNTGIHYDCGCIISENGKLIIPYGTNYNGVLNVPAIYTAYFSTFGALAWHLLLFSNSVLNLYGPILSPSAIVDRNAAFRQAGESLRSKTCHFVLARLLSTFHFLSLQSNQEDTYIVLTRCFERMASLTVDENQWIQPTYEVFSDKVIAEELYQTNVFYYVLDRLVTDRVNINQRILPCEIQLRLQEFTEQMPIVLNLQHFQTAFHRLNAQSSTSLQLLRFIFDSLEVLERTKYITNLARFYILLHQTYTHLISEDEFHQITLEELQIRAQTRSQHWNDTYDDNGQNDPYTIIARGIEAVNNYHEYTQGLIKPGACNRSQQFEKVSIDTPVSYLLTTNNDDEGNIIMRILSILVDSHNHALNLLSEGNSCDPILANLVKEIVSKEVSILQIANYDTGILNFNAQDRKSIERWCLSSVINNDEQNFFNESSSLKFDFQYVQSQIIRNYLLLCRINYRHIQQVYQCRIIPVSTTFPRSDRPILDLDEKYCIELTNEQLENDWTYLRTISLDNLYHSFVLLRQLASILKIDSNRADLSTSLFDFVEHIDNDNEFLERIRQYQIKDFPLCHIDHVMRLYVQLIHGFEHLFMDIPLFLRTPIPLELNARIVEKFNQNISQKNSLETIQTTIEMITQLLNDLKNSRNTFLQQSSRSLVEICRICEIDSPILDWIPLEICCENYVPINIHLVRIRSILQERKVNIEERAIQLWHEYTDDRGDTSDKPLRSSPNDPRESIEIFQYSVLFKLEIRRIPYSSMNLFRQLQQSQTPEVLTSTRPHKFTIKRSDGNGAAYMTRIDKISERLQTFVDDEHVLLDANEIVFDFGTSKISSLDYRVVERKDLISVEFHFRQSIVQYFTVVTNRIVTVIQHFLNVNQPALVSADTHLCFYDEIGMCIEDVKVADLYTSKEKVIVINVKKKSSMDDMECEINVTDMENGVRQTIFCDMIATWEHIELWLKQFSQKTDHAIENVAFLSPKQHLVLDKTESLSSFVTSPEFSAINVIDQQSVMSVTVYYKDSYQSVQVFKSMKIISLLKNQYLRTIFKFGNTIPEHFTMSLEKENQSIPLSKHDVQKTLRTFCKTENDELNIRLVVSKVVTIHDGEKETTIVLPKESMTTRDLLKLINTDRCLATKETKRILKENEAISFIQEDKFLLVDRKDVCHVEITSSGFVFENYFSIKATIIDVCNEQQIKLDTQYLLYLNEIIAAKETQLIYFMAETPIHFTTTENSLPVTVRVNLDEHDKTIQFSSNRTMTVERLCFISCRMFNVSEDNAELRLTDGTNLDEGLSLNDMDATRTNFEFLLCSSL
ncbi:unnamed protein product [Adineta ricciae]|uniref:Uncharacterized protein n=1 Tax=Adineta ricciae TaxID=249248 RepID=A0A814UPN2_ADIRI|nr:unnamed protein product [Adineta ricciae]